MARGALIEDVDPHQLFICKEPHQSDLREPAKHQNLIEAVQPVGCNRVMLMTLVGQSKPHVISGKRNDFIDMLVC